MYVPKCEKSYVLRLYVFFLKDVIDIDSSGSMHSCAYEGFGRHELCLLAEHSSNSFNPSTVPVSGAFDFEAAYPSVIH